MNDSNETEGYAGCNRRLAQGWNTWSTYSLLTHALLPEGLSLNLNLNSFSAHTLTEALVYVNNYSVEVIPGIRARDGAYTSLCLKWQGIHLRVESASIGDELLLLITPLATPPGKMPLLLLEAGFLWNRPGWTRKRGETLIAEAEGGRMFEVHATRCSVNESRTPLRSNYLALPLDTPIGICCGKPRTIETIFAHIKTMREQCMAEAQTDEMRALVRSCMAWDTIYDAGSDSVFTPVSRVWNTGWGGRVLFCWDTYFAAWLAAAGDNRDLAYANAITITRTMTPEGFVPNFAGANGAKSYDRSQPPVGSMTFMHLYQTFGDLWVLKDVFDDLLRWNRWWISNRETDGLLCWGSNDYPRERNIGSRDENKGIHERLGAALESGLDNSPMYDDIPFDTERNQLKLADVGLNALYVADCMALAKIARLIGRTDAEHELCERAATYRQSLQRLWSEEDGIFLNRRLDTGEFSHRMSPTCFYPLLADAATPEQAQRMMKEHFWNPEEFAGEWILPSIARNDPAYPDNHYWRGRIWAPMNFLVYLGLCRAGLNEARAVLAEKSAALILKEWRENGHIHENYNAETGQGDDVKSSDPFYLWGALLALIPILEKENVPHP